MTDADVDGAHIRTLLLTFFFRHMVSVIEGGHLFIGQPPLFKLKHGKAEKYLLNERELEQELLLLGTAGVQLRVGGDKGAGRTLSEERLRQFVGEILEFRRLRERLAKRGVVPAEWLEAFARHRPLARKRISRESLLQEIPRALGRPEVELTVQTETDDSVVATGVFDGEEQKLNLSLFGSGEYARLLEVYAQIEPSDRPPFTLVGADGAEQTAATRDALADLVFQRGRAGTGIQRYKGLGEMNPEQLWDTTMNPETRTLLRVSMDDAIAADEIFTKLMGDQVEPRREFIETHALEATIDV
jgi:DNA gyrase subunit B